jgi:hypothetical protein
MTASLLLSAAQPVLRFRNRAKYPRIDTEFVRSELCEFGALRQMLIAQIHVRDAREERGIGTLLDNDGIETSEIQAGSGELHFEQHCIVSPLEDCSVRVGEKSPQVLRTVRSGSDGMEMRGCWYGSELIIHLVFPAPAIDKRQQRTEADGNPASLLVDDRAGPGRRNRTACKHGARWPGREPVLLLTFRARDPGLVAWGSRAQLDSTGVVSLGVLPYVPGENRGFSPGRGRYARIAKRQS